MGRRSLIALVSIFGASLLAAECRTEPKPPPGPEPDGGIVQDASADAGADALADASESDGGQPPEPVGKPCERACETLSRLGCPGGEDPSKCVATCTDTEASAVARFCPEQVATMRGKPGADGGLVCDQDELDRAFVACE